MVSNTETQYAIEVPERGYVASYGGLHINVTQQPDRAAVFDTFDNALAQLKTSMGRYTSMGCPEIAKTLRIVTRTATLTYSDWTPAMLKAVAE